MANMKAVIVVPGPQGPTLEQVTVPRPTPGPDELLVRVRSAGVNRTDLRRVQQHHALGPGEVDIAGLEMAGEVVACGDHVQGVQPGQAVFGMTKNCYAEYTLIDHRLALPLPAGFNFHQAAAVATVYPTAHDALITNGAMKPGEAVLVQAVASAVGLATLEIARLMGAATVIGTVERDLVVPELRARGLDLALRSSSPDLPAQVREATGGRGADVIVDMIGRGVLDANVAAAAILGRIVSVGRLGGFTDQIDLDQLALKRLSLIGVTFRTRSVQEKQALLQRFRADLFPHFESGRLAPAIDSVFPLGAALSAQAHMAGNAHFGKILLEP